MLCKRVRLAVWPEVRLDKKRWIIPPDRVKSGREFRIHLSDHAVLVLKEALKLRSDKHDFVFPGANGGAMEKMTVARALSRHVERVTEHGGKRLRPHDLRRTFRTMLSRLGIQPHVAELCMNHQETETMRVTRRRRRSSRERRPFHTSPIDPDPKGTRRAKRLGFASKDQSRDYSVKWRT